MEEHSEEEKGMITLRTEVEFDSAHYLEGYDGFCSRMHGHTWRIILLVKGHKSLMNDIGILWDFTNLKKIANEYDHYILNNKMSCNPTAENIAITVYDKLKNENSTLKYRVRVYESKKSFAELGDEI
jgi:6-pyruvoyltetrahydropterin/6-carboxytetrahydropterin synthase